MKKSKKSSKTKAITLFLVLIVLGLISFSFFKITKELLDKELGQNSLIEVVYKAY
ncbi:hypothetical protein [Clostridium cellulovorans]|uniref:Uncharacterized protein n=1 Tax=Clostridium cellulovorans (strain ATCC 35296 / DSM 3052 / OCM 3 / 743B) TaxID=573061 RepID=D9SRU8_CLOC7|nr:hypothetical protein [Clostridium cellulovorans]ADL50465.1 hypothetical protein Clocel_0694 [Clostridium cellulovorans 743B]